MSRSLVFQVAFALQNAPMTDMELSNLHLSLFEIEKAVPAKFDINLSMRETDEGMIATIYYSTDLFEAATISKMIDHFQLLLESIVVDPDQRLSDLVLMTEAEHHQLVERHRTQKDNASDRARTDTGREFVAPRNALELQLAQIWEELLGVS